MTIAWSFAGVALDSTNGVTINDFALKTMRKAAAKEVAIGRGALLTDQSLGVKEIEIAGTIRGDSTALYFANVGTIEGAFALAGERDFIADDARYIPCVVSKAFDLSTVKGSALTEGRFKVSLTALDPVWLSKYGSTDQTAISAGTTTDSITNSGDAAAHWRGQITTASNFTDATLEIYNDTIGAVIRLAGFGLTTSELMVIDTRLGRVAQESGAYPDSNFGIEVVDGEFFKLGPGDNQIRIEASDAVTLDWYWKDSYWGPA